MDKSKLSEIMSMDNSIINMQDLVLMQRLSSKYPYCALFRFLDAKFAKIINAFNKEDLLQTAGVYASDREYLKQILDSAAIKKTFFTKKSREKMDYDIISKINSYQDEQLSDNPTKQELLEKFLKIENPKKDIPQNKDYYGGENINDAIKQSAKDDFKIVTETMAKIYAKQGDKPKAIKIYQILMTKNPKKSAYFSSQIENLKNN